VSVHNIALLVSTAAAAREAILEGRFAPWRERQTEALASARVRP
jgi:queuine/archaeosine tRNA-ribosyltransferase